MRERILLQKDRDYTQVHGLPSPVAVDPISGRRGDKHVSTNGLSVQACIQRPPQLIRNGVVPKVSITGKPGVGVRSQAESPDNSGLANRTSLSQPNKVSYMTSAMKTLVLQADGQRFDLRMNEAGILREPPYYTWMFSDITIFLGYVHIAVVSNEHEWMLKLFKKMTSKVLDSP